MKVVLLGAGGRAGSRILAELAGRGHEVIALSRTPEKIPVLDGVRTGAIDVRDGQAVVEAVHGADAVINATKFKEIDTQGLIDAVTQAGVKRFISVGGAGSLWVAPGVREMDGPGFPDFVKPEASAGARLLDQLRASSLDWTFISPSRIFEPGQRTGVFRFGADDLLFDADGKSWISMEDYAVALVDELERPAHVKKRFTVGY